MTIPRRTLTSASIAAIGLLALAACKDSTSPLNVTPDQLASMGESVAAEIESGALSLTAQGVTATNGGAPTFARLPQRTATFFRGLSMSRIVASRSAAATCGVASQDPPVDTDGDQVPDNFSISFGLPECHIVDGTSAIDITGALNVSDPQPGTPGMALNFGLDNFTVAISGDQGSGSVVRDGSGSVSASETGLSQAGAWYEAVQVTGAPKISANIDYAATFVPAQGQSIVIGQALPNGAYSPNGSVDYREGNATASFSVTTITPLQYSASCAAGVENGTSLTPFTAGTIQVTANGRSANVTYSGCNSAVVTLVE